MFCGNLAKFAIMPHRAICHASFYVVVFFFYSVHIRIHIPEIVHDTHSTNEVLVHGHGHGHGHSHGHGHGHSHGHSHGSSLPAEVIGSIIGNSAGHSGGHYAPSHGSYSRGSSLSPGIVTIPLHFDYEITQRKCYVNSI